VDVGAPNPPAFHYLQVATVENEQVRIDHLIDISTGIQGIQLEKMNSTGNFVQLVQLPATQENLTYIDSDVEVGRRSYTYRARVIDSCGRLSAISNTAQTIHLQQVKDDIRLLNYLYWNPYSEFDGSILAYNIYRGIDGVFNGTPLVTLPNDQLSYTDDLNDVAFTGKVCYYVEAIEGSNVYNDPKISRSNVACQLFEPIIYIPNAFTPNGFNPCFFPEITNFDPSEYRMVIFDRWGQEIFHSTSPSEKWCGYIRNSNEMAVTATYVYMITLKDGDGNEIIKRGHVTLVK
jgi:gliding motility-associated-like protein